MTVCPVCKSTGALRRGRIEPGRYPRYLAICVRCGSYFSVPEHLYFQLYGQRAHVATEMELTA